MSVNLKYLGEISVTLCKKITLCKWSCDRFITCFDGQGPWGGRCHIMRPNNIKYDRTMGPNSDRLDMVRTECSQTQPRAGGFSPVFRQFFVFFTDNMFMGRIF